MKETKKNAKLQCKYDYKISKKKGNIKEWKKEPKKEKMEKQNVYKIIRLL
jgi:hypothetical protein